MKPKSPTEFLDEINDEFGEKVESRTTKEKAGSSENTFEKIWLKVERDTLKDLISFLHEFQQPHFISMFGRDLDEEVEISYLLSLFYDQKFGEIPIVISVSLSKDDLWLPTITDLIRGALTTEREMKEMFGVEIKDIPDDRHVYLPYDHPEEEYPLRKDECGVELEDIYEKEGQK